MRIAVPSKGRLRDPAIVLLEDAGLGPETPGDRALAFPCRNAPVEGLLVRADDVPEYVQDGVVDCGITGLDIVRESGARVTELLRLGFGHCTLEAAVPEESPVTAVADLDGARVATSFPRLAREFLPSSIELVDVHGSVELAPRLGLADAIVDLVSSGSTLRTNGLRSIGRLLESEAVLIGPPEAGADALQLASRVPQRRRRARRALSDAQRAGGRARADLRARAGIARAERAAAVGAGDGRRAQRRSRGGDLAAAAGARGGRRVVDPASFRSSECLRMKHTVAEIVADVRARGDEALREWAVRLDGAEPARAEPPDGLPEDAILALADRVRRWHTAQLPADVRLEVEPGVELERRWVPLRSVGIYVPRRLVSTLVMCTVPAQVAGVERIVVVTPPDGAGLVAAAARALGVDEVWAVGGAHAIAALAYGTDTIPRVDKIVGPGSAFVNEAKLLVSRDVAIDLPAGPSEVAVVLGRGGSRAIAELELAAQAEHGADSVCTLVDGDDVEAALAEVERLAPEHVVLLGEATSLAGRIRNAGAIFVGDSSPVASGDYATGGNHVLPTGGWGRSSGGLGVETFMKPVTVQRLTADGLARVAPVVRALAAVEGMPAHAAAVER